MRKLALFLLLALSLCLCGCEKTPHEPEVREINGKQYVETFYDDFDGRKLDTTKWELCPEWQRQDAGGYWDHDMISLKDGNLVVRAALEDGVPKSGAIRSRGLFSQNQGYFEIRCTLQTAKGYWFAFWLMDENMQSVSGNGAEDGAEIDIMESHDITGCINHAIHWDGYENFHKSESMIHYDPAMYEGYHTYALEWTDSEYIFYVDGVESWRTSYPGMCQNPLYLKISSEFGTWAGSYDPAEFPSDVFVDYVKVFAVAPEDAE
ncbi:MAG: glycoside hydrolase family 16 protein [Clostridia bacterium]|nr:glycoside hydrolase family 16 protein [Clostridia bacterium]MBQ4624733.1 glycoside hydrolase family 16 protein [Clostridia bacterium]